MSKRGFWPGIAVLVLLPAAAGAQVTIDHNAVGCIVAGHYPKMNACFSPTANLARARVYFRAEGTPSWYFVDMKSDAPCFTGILPKPKKSIKKLQYYVEATDKAFAEARTAEFLPDVVEQEGQCRKDTPAAPFVNNAAVTVGAAAGAPAVPVGFVAGGLSGGVIAAGVVGVGLATTGVVVATNGDDATPTTIPGTTPGTNPPVTTTPATTTTSTTLPLANAGFNPVFKIFPNPPVGKEPLQVTFDMCDSTGTDLRFVMDFDGDGVEDLRGRCSATRIYSIAGISAAAPATTTAPQTRSYPARNCVIEGASGRRECRDFLVTVSDSQTLTINSLDAAPASRRLAWASQLEVEGASGQVVVNGEAASFAGRGRSTAVAMGRRGENRVEAQLVQGAGKAGTWRFDLGSTGSLAKGSVRVIAGEVALITPDAVVFRMKGQPGERVVFSFRTGN